MDICLIAYVICHFIKTKLRHPILFWLFIYLFDVRSGLNVSNNNNKNVVFCCYSVVIVNYYKQILVMVSSFLKYGWNKTNISWKT